MDELQLRSPATPPSAASSSPDDFAARLADYFLGRHPVMDAARSAAALVAKSDWPAMISGETGTGKDMLAQAIHAGSRRGAEPSQVVAVSGLGDTAWSVLFGHRKGAFTGAERDYAGVFKVAQGSSLILEDVSDLPLKVQPMLLRAVEKGLFRPLGEDREVHADVRVISTTNAAMPEEIRRGRFRPDLFQRLSLLRVTLPPLRDHLSDLEIYVPHFLARAESQEPERKSVSAEGMKVLMNHSWPRNVRELEHVLYRASVEVESAVIGADDLRRLLLDEPTPPAIRRPGRPSVRIGRDSLLQVMREVAGNKREAARRLGIAAGTLYRLLKTHRIRLKDLI